MHDLYNFHFLETISKQLVERLDGLALSVLDDTSIPELKVYQSVNHARQGVYVLHLDGSPVYLGKADDVAERLKQHRNKLSGRLNIVMEEIGYKALLLDRSMSTAANEDVLIAMFKTTHQGLWNGAGFGPKDPGKNRDATEPSTFDSKYPINSDFGLYEIDDDETISSLFAKMKRKLPFVFRFEPLGDLGDKHLDLKGVPRTAEALLRKSLSVFPPGWKGIVLSFGMVVYRTNNTYPHGVEILSGP